MIETAYVTVKSNGKFVTVKYWEDRELREGPAIFPARPASFAAIIQYIHTQFNGRTLSMWSVETIQGLLFSPHPKSKLLFRWADAQQREAAA